MLKHKEIVTKIGEKLCSYGIHKYRYSNQKYGDVYATEATCVRCEHTKLTNTTPVA